MCKSNKIYRKYFDFIEWFTVYNHFISVIFIIDFSACKDNSVIVWDIIKGEKIRYLCKVLEFDFSIYLYEKLSLGKTCMHISDAIRTTDSKHDLML